MGRKKKIEKEVTADAFTVDLTASAGLSDALSGFAEPPVIEPSLEAPLVDISLDVDKDASPGKVRKSYTKRKKDEVEMDLVEGEDIQMFVDLIIPMAIAGVHNMTNDKKMSPDAIMLTTRQEDKMNRLAQRVADKIKLNMNPFLGLGIGIAVAYGGNYMKNKP